MLLTLKNNRQLVFLRCSTPVILIKILIISIVYKNFIDDKRSKRQSIFIDKVFNQI